MPPRSKARAPRNSRGDHVFLLAEFTRHKIGVGIETAKEYEYRIYLIRARLYPEDPTAFATLMSSGEPTAAAAASLRSEGSKVLNPCPHADAALSSTATNMSPVLHLYWRMFSRMFKQTSKQNRRKGETLRQGSNTQNPETLR
jgi:hypothetical protein